MQVKKTNILKRILKGRQFYFLSSIILVFVILILALYSQSLKVYAGVATLNKGHQIYYQNYIPEAQPYSTHFYTYSTPSGAKVAYCIEAEKSALGGGSYETVRLSAVDYPLLTKVLAFGYGSDSCKLDEIWPNITTTDPNRAYLYTHIAATYAYVGSISGAGENQWYKGLSSAVAEQYGIGDFIRLCDSSSLDLNGSYVEYMQDPSSSSHQKVAYLAAFTPSNESGENGGVTLTKLGEVLMGFTNGTFLWEEHGLPGSTFELRAKGNITDSLGTVQYTDGALIRNITTGADGSASIDGLLPGSYQLIETHAPNGYIITTSSCNFTVTKENPNQNISFQNERQTISLDITKLETGSNDTLKGGSFALYNDEDIYNIYGNLIVPAGTLLATASADSHGKIDFALDLPFGKFHMEELSPPSGHYLNTSPLKFSFEYPDSDTRILEVSSEFYNKPFPHFAYLALCKAEDTFLLHQSNYQTGEDDISGFHN